MMYVFNTENIIFVVLSSAVYVMRHVYCVLIKPYEKYRIFYRYVFELMNI